MHQINLTVRGYELDSYGHVNNAVYLNYMEQARWEMFRSLELLDPLDHEGFKVVVTEISVRYQREARLLDELTILTKCRRVPPYIIFEHRIIRNEDSITLAKGKVKTVLLDSNRSVTDIPPLMEKIFQD